MICNHPSHIYHSALPFSPSSSWLHECYDPELSHGVKVVQGVPPNWGICSHTVPFGISPQALAGWGDNIAVGLQSGNVIIIDAITGTYTSTLLSHNGWVRSLAFSSDGTSLVSGGNDKVVNLWDMQTGGVIKSFWGHTSFVLSISISSDNTMIASGSDDKTIRLWDVQIGECHCIINGHSGGVNSVCFSPTNAQFLFSASDDNTVQRWDINGHRTGPTYEGTCVVFSSDGTHFVSWGRTVATIWSSDSGLLVTKLQAPNDNFQCCCFSPDGKLVAGSTGCVIYIWDTTSLTPHPTNTFVGHNGYITSLTYCSSFVSASSKDQSIKFWHIDTPSITSDKAGLESTPLTSASVQFLSIDAKNGIAISINSAGVASTWDLSTGLCKTTFHIPIENFTHGDAQLVDGRLTFVWSTFGKLHIWDSETGEKNVDTPTIPQCLGLRVSGDGSKVFLLDDKSIQALSIQTGDIVGEARFKAEPPSGPLTVDGSRVWVYPQGSQTQGWDFGSQSLTPMSLSNAPLSKPCLDFIRCGQEEPIGLSRIKNVVTGEEVIRLSGPTIVRWDGWFLIAGYQSGEVLILDFTQMTLDRDL